MPELLAQTIIGLSLAVLALLLPFAAHRTYLLLLSRRPPPELPRRWSGRLPPVTVQLPLYNEAPVARRVIDAACSLDYPARALEIQVLDDSTDETVDLVARRVAWWRARGVNVCHIRRRERSGFKAGALAAGVRRAQGEFLLVLDSDFVPEPDLVRKLLPPFRLPRVGMVQARWDHLNEDANWLTRAQSLLLDGHFFFEHGGRYRGGLFFNFNGTAGMWRRECLEDAGGWQADTLTEDLDISYRAQMRGWRFVFLEDIGVPAELPDQTGAFEIQQRRWSQGGIQTARKLLPELLRGPWPLSVKKEAVIHLCGHIAYPLTLLLGLLIYPSALARRALGGEEFLFIDLVVFFLATIPFVIYYAAAGRKRNRPWGDLVPSVAVTLATGVGLTAPATRAVLRGLAGRSDGFARTPKKGSGGVFRERPGSQTPDTLFKLAMATVMSLFVGAAMQAQLYASIPFLMLFAVGYWSLGVGGLKRFGTGPRIPQQQRVEGQPEEENRPEGPRPLAGLQVRTQTQVRDECEAA
ncbi:MAG: glycosyltransferase [Gammaproteobacteria bacterium]|nr:glycosyltransferase [Gammaproteobacteria bacterium]